ncbi:MAG: hypothetical protein H7Y59_16460 [Anaerolineales bacterium]|nr:hypothetical protein [Anaerolineales bacterium]
MKYKILVIASLLTLLSACSQAADSAPTPLVSQSLPTAVALTGEAILATANAMTPNVLPTETFLPTQESVSTALPTITPTFEAGFTELAQIHILAPGPMSSLVSPFNLQVMLISGDSELVQVDLLGEDGRVLQRDLERVTQVYNGNFRNFRLTFEIRAVSEAGYIRISTKDKLGRIQALNTMPVLLYSIGSAQVNPVANMIYERVMLDGIKDGDKVSGGVLNLKGRLWPFNDQPVFVELLLPDGRPISSRILTFNGIETQEFETTLPYKITEPTEARLTFRQDNPLLSVTDPELKNYIYVYTMEVLLNP